ncbi:MAG: methyltransferase family protein [Anaerolineales bacterium]|jgi:protein-S-isoprenylcysteine O-methyltransferase Ste14
MLKLMPTTYLLIAVLLIILLHFLIPIQFILISPWNLIGLLPLLFGIWINISADRAFKKAGTTVKPFEKSSTLIQHGVFRISRNPMYLGFVSILLGISLLLRSLSPYIVVVLFAILMEAVFIPSEEKMLFEAFGDQWERYRSQVRKWI